MATTALAKRGADLASLLRSAEKKNEIARALPRHISSDNFIRTALTTVQKTPALLQCSAASIYSALLEAASLGLQVDGQLGHAYLVPFGDKATMIVGYKGMITMAARSSRPCMIEARAVYEADEFDYGYGLDSWLKHKPVRVSPTEMREAKETGVDPRGELVAAYAVARYAGGGGTQFHVCEADEIEEAKNRSRAKTGPWITDYAPMAMKTAVRRLAKFLALSTEDMAAIHRSLGDEDAYEAEARDAEFEVVDEAPSIDLEGMEGVEAPEDATQRETPAQRKRGRPKGSKNKPKPAKAPQKAQKPPAKAQEKAPEPAANEIHDDQDDGEVDDDIWGEASEEPDEKPQEVYPEEPLGAPIERSTKGLITAHFNDGDITRDQLKGLLAVFGVPQVSDLTENRAKQMCDWIRNGLVETAIRNFLARRV